MFGERFPIYESYVGQPTTEQDVRRADNFGKHLIFSHESLHLQLNESGCLVCEEPLASLPGTELNTRQSTMPRV